MQHATLLQQVRVATSSSSPGSIDFSTLRRLRALSAHQSTRARAASQLKSHVNFFVTMLVLIMGALTRITDDIMLVGSSAGVRSWSHCDLLRVRTRPASLLRLITFYLFLRALTAHGAKFTTGSWAERLWPLTTLWCLSKKWFRRARWHPNLTPTGQRSSSELKWTQIWKVKSVRFERE